MAPKALNSVVEAPTGSGKTVLFELAIIRMLMSLDNEGKSLRSVYMAPTKVEKVLDITYRYLNFL
jgi:replicative superfamily II helicase